MPPAPFLAAALHSRNERFALQNLRTGRVLATTVEMAFDSASRRKGLLGREGLAAQSALLIAPSSGIHTFFMRFAIDVVFVARDGAVKKTYEQLNPWRIAIAVGAYAVIELPAGALRAADTHRKDLLQLVRV